MGDWVSQYILSKKREDWTEAKAVIGKEAAVTHIIQGKECFCGLESVHVLSVFRHEYGDMKQSFFWS